MAGTFAARILVPRLLVRPNSFSISPNFNPIVYDNPNPNLNPIAFRSSRRTMAEQVNGGTPENLQHHQNGAVSDASLAPLFKIKKLSENTILPTRASPLSAGYDLSSAVEMKVSTRGKALVPTNLSIAIPEGTYARVAPRSGLAWKHSIDVGAGVIDADYRGPVGVILFNHSDVDFEVKAGDRIAQLIIEKILTPDVI